MDMVERVARAILKRRFYDGEEKFYDGLDGFWSEIKGGQLDDAKAEARAAIEAMREPTEDMRSAGDDARKYDVAIETNTLATWRAMIDDALTPSPASK